MRQLRTRPGRAPRTVLRAVALGLTMVLVLAACGDGNDVDAEIDDADDVSDGATGEDTDDEAAEGENVYGGVAPPDDFPRRPITLTVVYPAGGGMDVTARTLADVAEEITGFEFRVQNRDGAAGLVGHTYLAAESDPDGYEVGVLANLLFEDIILRDTDFGIDRFQPLGFIGFDPLIMINSDASTVAGMDYDEAIEFARNNPGELRHGTVPPGLYESVIDLIEDQEDVEFNRVAYDGGDPGITDLLGGNIDLFIAFYAEVESQIEAGAIDPVAVIDQASDPRLPDVPPLAELGLDVDAATFGASRFLTVPPETDPEVQEYLAAMFQEVMTSDLAAERFEEIGVPLAPFGKDEAESWFADTFATLESEFEGIEVEEDAG